MGSPKTSSLAGHGLGFCPVVGSGVSYFNAFLGDLFLKGGSMT